MYISMNGLPSEIYPLSSKTSGQNWLKFVMPSISRYNLVVFLTVTRHQVVTEGWNSTYACHRVIRSLDNFE